MLVLAMEFSRSDERAQERSLTTEQRRSDPQRGGGPGETEVSSLPAGSSTEGRVASGQQRVPASEWLKKCLQVE